MDQAPHKPPEETAENAKPAGTMRTKLYSRLNVSVRTMDIIIITIFVLLLLALFIGIVLGS